MESYQNCCRCCFTPIDDLKNSSVFTQLLRSQCSDLVHFELHKSSVSDVICLTCNQKLKEFTDFKFKVIDTDQKFTSLLANRDELKFDIFLPTDEIKLEPEDANLLVLREIAFDSTPIEVRRTARAKKTVNRLAIIQSKNLKQLEVAEVPKLLKKPRQKRAHCEKRARQKWANSFAEHFCPICNKYIAEYRKMDKHIKRMHHSMKDVLCDKCPYTCYNTSEMKFHMIRSHIPKEHRPRNAICPTCGAGFATNGFLNHHIRRKHLQHVYRKILCDICGYKAAVVHHMKSHMMKHISKESLTPLKCQDCDAVYYLKSSLMIHRDAHHSTKPSIVCFCGKSFRQNGTYKKHCLVVHEGFKPHQCTVCSKKFSGKQHLGYHMRALHSEIELKPCEYCGKQFRTDESLKRHLAFHLPARFPCKLCDEKFHENRLLMDHMSKHEKLEFQCHHCDRSYRLQSQLKTHLSKNNAFRDKTTFKCELCSSTFTRKSTYREHAMRMHKELSKDDLAAFIERIKKSIPEELKEQNKQQK